MVLNDVERQSAVFQKLTKHYEERLASLRRKNDNDLTPEQTAKLRGRIFECDAFLRLAKEPVSNGSE